VACLGDGATRLACLGDGATRVACLGDGLMTRHGWFAWVTAWPRGWMQEARNASARGDDGGRRQPGRLAGWDYRLI
jgi:hypothetical protein